MLLTLIQGLIFIAYITFLMVKFKGPLSSISQSWYSLKTPLKYLFTLFTSSLGVLMMYHVGSSDLATTMFVISGVGLAFVGFSTAFKDYKSITPYVHSVGAAIGIVFALIGIGLNGSLISWVPFIAFIILSLLIILLKIKNSTWWVEIVAFLCVIIGLLF